MAGILSGKVAIIVGAGKGLGLAIGRTFAKEGATLVLVARTEGALQEARALVEKEGGKAFIIAADVTESGVSDRIVSQAYESHGSVDIVVNSANTFVWKNFLELGAEDWHETLTTHLTAPFLMTQAAGRIMGTKGKGKGGVIINIGSIHGSVADGNVVPQCAAKAGVLGLTRAAAEALREQCVRVNAIVPGAIEPNSADTTSEVLTAKITQADIAQAALFLASDAARGLTGLCLDAHGITRPVVASS